MRGRLDMVGHRPAERPGGGSERPRRLCGAILETLRELYEDDLLIFLSGGKGVHVGIPAVWHPDPSPTFHLVAKSFCLELAATAGSLSIL